MADESLSSIESPVHTNPTRGISDEHNLAPACLPERDVVRSQLVERAELLEHGRSDVSNRLTSIEMDNQQREAELLRLKNENRKLKTQVETLTNELAHSRNAAAEIRADCNDRVRQVENSWQTKLDGVEISLREADRRYASLEDTCQSLRRQLLETQSTSEEWESRARSFERVINQYQDGADVRKEHEEKYQNTIREKLNSKEVKLKHAKEECARLDSELQHSRSHVLVLQEQIRLLEEEKDHYKRQVSVWEARRKSGSVVDAEQLILDKGKIEKLEEELGMIYTNNKRLLTIIKESGEAGLKHLSQLIKSIPDTDQFVFCGYDGRPSFQLVAHGEGRPGHMKTSDSQLRTAIDSHNAASRCVKKKNVIAETSVPVASDRELHYWIPRNVYDLASKFRSESCPTIPLEVFYPFLIDLCGIWRERMNKVRSFHEDQLKKATTRPKSVDRKAPKLDNISSQLSLLRREADLLVPHPKLAKVIGSLERLCKSAIFERDNALSETRRLREDLQRAIVNRDPHVTQLKSAFLQMTGDARNCAQRLGRKLEDLLIHFDRNVDTMQLPDSWRMLFTSFSKTMRETFQRELETLRLCVNGAERADEQIALQLSMAQSHHCRSHRHDDPLKHFDDDDLDTM